MRDTVKIICMALLLLCVSSRLHEHKTYEIRRPLKYFYRLLQVKAALNPLLHRAATNSYSCSSRIGPYCPSMNFDKFQERTIKKLPQQISDAYEHLLKSAERQAAMLDEQQLRPANVFFIRDPVSITFDTHIKTIIDRQMTQEISNEEQLYTFM